ncbi:hypothetical protein NEA10_03365 [Phormidium yuhuli AB48]|uniref:Uncharacterized protein n=1 Tax=Phormidium yuhuli AB48 TaxID=2940671 RepID=A0ABY5ATW1_9CYAN|nr:hypothetical protein [Phormidium yuhuli]USR91781.1 hypothetical protein NEA10_03365 [Phormidium yuhuli AB48]
MIPNKSQLTQWILAILLAIAIGYQVSPALALDASRVNRLESQVRQLQAQLRQINRQLDQVQARDRPIAPRLPREQPSQGDRPAESAPPPDPRLERLATLLMEQKQRLDSLEAQLSHLESSLESPNRDLKLF